MCVTALRERDWEGDEELAAALDARLGGGATPCCARCRSTWSNSPMFSRETRSLAAAGSTCTAGARTAYRHVWQPGDEVEEFASGMTKNLGAGGWELVTAGIESVSLPTLISPQGNDSWANFPTYRLFFKRPRSGGPLRGAG